MLQSENEYEMDFDADVSSRVSIHNREEFEIKIEYNLQEIEKKVSFKVECYLFIPSSLNINSETYSKELFYRDIKNYLRFKTPRILLQELLSAEFVQSPLYQLEKMKDEFQKSFSIEKVQAAVNELKMLGCVVRTALRDYHREMMAFLKRTKIPDISEDLDRFLDNVFEVQKRLREVRADYRARFPNQKQLLRYFQLTEDFLSNLIESESSKLILELKENIGAETVSDETVKKLKQSLVEERKLRSKGEFRMDALHNPKEKSQYLYYMSQYKKILASVLYLKIKKEKTKNQPSHLLGSIAAFLASVFSFATMVWISTKYAVNTAIFIFFASISYVFKDRIKEIVKLVVHPKMLSRFPDYDTMVFIDSTPPAMVGNVREKMQFVERPNVSPSVLSIREETRKYDLLYEEMNEAILLYQREISFDIDSIMKLNPRSMGVVDLMRYSIARYRPRMNEPDEDIYFYSEEKDELCSTTGSRCYFLNLILKYTSYHQNKERYHYERYRIIVKKSEIEQIELVSSL